MPRETVDEKARRYLAEGRLVVEQADAGTVQARCRGGGAVYRLAYSSGRWWCECPARHRCAHLAALALVTAPEHVAGGRA